MKRTVLFIFISILLLLNVNCELLQQILKQSKIQAPDVEVSGVKITGLNFDEIDLLFNIRVRNPNQIGVKLNGFDYDLKLQENSFLNGSRDETMEIQAEGDQIVQLPLTLNFQNIYRTAVGLKDKDSTRYQLSCGFLFNLPVLGEKRIPVSKSGTVPMIKLPAIKLHNLRLTGLNLTRADLELQIAIDNPNGFSLDFGELNYQLSVNGQDWASGQTSRSGGVQAKRESILKIPVSLNILQMGSSVYRILKGEDQLNYGLAGSVQVDGSLPMMQSVNLPFKSSGTVNLGK